jgi:hypothetical protein
LTSKWTLRDVNISEKSHLPRFRNKFSTTPRNMVIIPSFLCQEINRIHRSILSDCEVESKQLSCIMPHHIHLPYPINYFSGNIVERYDITNSSILYCKQSDNAGFAQTNIQWGEKSASVFSLTACSPGNLSSFRPFTSSQLQQP